MISVAAVDDHPLILQGFRSWIEGVEDFSFTGAHRTVADCLVGPTPQAVVLDLHLNDRSRPADNVRALKRAGAAVVVVSADEEPLSVIGAIEAGADGYLRKGDDLPALAHAIRGAVAGEFLVSVELAFVLSRDFRANRPALTPKEREVLEYFGAGLTWERVAARLGMKPATVKVHLRNIRAKYASPRR